MSKQKELVVLTLILLIAAGLRLYGLGAVPPGLSHDEVANWQIAQDILDGNVAIYFTAAYGHEPLYQYIQAMTVAAFGDHWLGLRWPSVAFGLLGLAATYTFTRYLFGIPVALLSISWLATSFWPLFYARVAYRAILLPFTAALSAYFLFRMIRRSSRQATGLQSHWSSDALFAGLFLGLSAYIYPAARVLPFILAAVVVYIKLIRPRLSVPSSQIALVLVISGVISAPLFVWLVAHPGAEYRVAEVREPLDRLLTGDPSLVWQNLIANLEFFILRGDPWPRYNVPNRPVFAEPTGAVLFIAGVLISLRRWRDPRYGLLPIWLLGSLVPSVITSDAPSSIRNILGLVVVFVFPALALVELGHWVRCQLSDFEGAIRDSSPLVLPVLISLALVPSALLTARDYFVRWPNNEIVDFDYQADLTAVAQRLNELPTETRITVSGLSVHTMDRASLELAARREVDDVRICDTRETLVIPSSSSGEFWLLVPEVVPFDEDLRRQLTKWGARETLESSFTSYRLSDHTLLHRDLTQLQTRAALPDGTSVQLPISFDGHLAFLGHQEMGDYSDDSCTLLTYWQVQDPPPAQVRVFVHLVDDSGEVVAQDDGLASPSESWHHGDIIVQKHVLISPLCVDPFRAGTVRLGLYRLQSRERLTASGSEYLKLASQAR